MRRDSRRRNWIGGEARPALSGRSFVPPGGRVLENGPPGPVGEGEQASSVPSAHRGAGLKGESVAGGKLAWAASGAADAEAALGALDLGVGEAACGGGLRPQSCGVRGEARAHGASPQRNGYLLKLESLRELVERLLADPDPGGVTAHLLGLDPAELADSARERGKRWRALVAGAPLPSPRPGVALVSIPWNAGLWAPVEAVLECLARGWPTVLVTDPLLPSVGDALAQAAQGAGLASGALAILHGDTSEALGRLLADGSVQHLRAARPADSLARLERAWRAEPTFPSRVRHRGFGAGVLASAPRSSELETLQGRLVVLPDQGEAEAEASRLVLELCSRLPALSGQAAARPSHILCPNLRFSAFTSALLAALEGASSRDLTAKLTPHISRRAEVGSAPGDELHEAALEAGATLIHRGPPGAHEAPERADKARPAPPQENGRAENRQPQANCVVVRYGAMRILGLFRHKLDAV
ncbi:MAG: aldehyde dehydrogenase family protein, partial [Planctomycetota bacterium]|nr:aldehyde dehydrogenase family protein [Planctomycetota bacterium]